MRDGGSKRNIGTAALTLHRFKRSFCLTVKHLQKAQLPDSAIGTVPTATLSGVSMALMAALLMGGASVVVHAQTSQTTVQKTTAQSSSGAAKAAPAAQFPPYQAPRTADGKPDLNGIWQALVTADIDIQDHDAQAGPHPEIMGAYDAWPGGQGIVEGGEIPYKPEALAKKKENAEKRMVVNITSDPHRHDTGDPELKCYRPGVPRANYMPFPFQIVQSKDNIIIVYEFAHVLRTIYMNVNDKTIPRKLPRTAGWDGRTGTLRARRSSWIPPGSFPIPGSIERGITTARRFM